jgi:hypothetical protein
MTDEMMSLQALLEERSDTDLLREMIGFAAHRLMELEVETLTGAAHDGGSRGRGQRCNLSPYGLDMRPRAGGCQARESAWEVPSEVRERPKSLMRP